MNTPMNFKMKTSYWAMVILFFSNHFFAAPEAFSHVVFGETTATAGASYRGTLRVGHGCEVDGKRSGTTALIVHIPEGIVNVKPMPKPGWTLETKTEKLAKPIELHGKTISESVQQITWRGGLLPDAHYDEFVVMMNVLPDAIGKRYFKITQQCEKGSVDWAEIPRADKARGDYKTPAAELNVLPSTSAETHKH